LHLFVFQTPDTSFQQLLDILITVPVTIPEGEKNNRS